MAKLRISPDLDMHYRIDDYTDPWLQPETVLMLHGNAESGAVWYGWVPHLARRYRVVRPDMRGFGESTPMPRIGCPTLVITTEGAMHTSVEATRAWQQVIPNSTLLVLKGDSYHVAASHPEPCARAALELMSQHGAGQPGPTRPNLRLTTRTSAGG